MLSAVPEKPFELYDPLFDKNSRGVGFIAKSAPKEAPALGLSKPLPNQPYIPFSFAELRNDQSSAFHLGSYSSNYGITLSFAWEPTRLSESGK
ncbi:hypothetical protein ACFX2C_008767 [Malus domestica]